MKIVYFDMDGTLIRNTDALSLLCDLNDKSEEKKKVDALEAADVISWVEADYLKSEMIKGLPIAELEMAVLQDVKMIDGLSEVLKRLRQKGYVSVLATVGPKDVARVISECYGFDTYYGSEYQVKDGVYTGIIANHLGIEGKYRMLMAYCDSLSENITDIVAVGDSDSDMKVFARSDKAIAINYTNSVVKHADICMRTDDLCDILDHIH